MPRITFITDENTYKNNKPEYKNDPAAYRDPIDLCKKCFKNPDPTDIAQGLSIGEDWVREQLDEEILENEGLFNEEHPSYKDDDYECFLCGKKLTEKDD